MSSHLTVLDVGHGNCSVLFDNGLVAVIDAGKGPYASIYLSSVGITEVDLIIISHTDDDHLAGVIGLLSSEQVKVKKVILNSDAAKDTKIWRDVRAILASQFNAGKIDLQIGVFRGVIRDWVGKDVTLDALSPNVFNALGGVGARDENGKKISANSHSIVVRVSHKSGIKALLAADMEQKTLDEIVSSGQDLAACTLVFPHHGGKPGTDFTTDFSNRLMDAVKPSTVLFSNGRGKHGNPRPEIIASVCSKSKTYVACTQISENCHSQNLKQDRGSFPFSAGSDEGRSCAGSVVINLETGSPHMEQVSSHAKFVQQLEKPMCRISAPST